MRQKSILVRHLQFQPRTGRRELPPPVLGAVVAAKTSSFLRGIPLDRHAGVAFGRVGALPGLRGHVEVEVVESTRTAPFRDEFRGPSLQTKKVLDEALVTKAGAHRRPGYILFLISCGPIMWLTSVAPADPMDPFPITDSMPTTKFI